MGQCDICSRDADYNAVDCDNLMREIGTHQLGKDINKLREDNREYIDQYKFSPMPDKSFYRGKKVNLLR
jgi:hypothetical protein